MATTIAKLNIHLGAQTAALEQGLGRAQVAVSSFTGMAMRGLAGLAGAGGVGFAVKLAADAEQAQVAFRTLLGSAEDAERVLGEINQFAAETPFETPELRDAGRMLVAFRTQADQVVPTMRMLGDLAAGTNQPIGELAEIFGKARVQGRLFMEDINQLTGRGIPIIQELAKQFGVTETEVRGLVEKGRVHFTNLEEAFRSLTSEGGMFAGLMAAQSKTLTGEISTLKDNVSLLAAAFGEQLLPLVKAATEAALVLTDKLSGVDGATMQTVVQVAAFAGAFAATVAVVPRVVAAVRAVIATVRALATTSAIAQGVIGGPAGIAKVLLGLALGAAAAAGVGYAFDRFSEQAQTATAEAKQAASGVAQAMQTAAAQAGTAAKGQAAGLQTAADAAAEAKKRMEELRREGEQLAASLRTPEEVFTDTMRRFDELLEAGAISWETYERAVVKAGEEMREALASSRELESPQNRSVAYVTRGSAEAFSAVQAGQRAWEDRAEKERLHKEHMAKLEALRKEVREQAKSRVTVQQVTL